MTETAKFITQDEVVAAAESLVAANARVTILAVREKLGRGSFTTVKKFLDRWQSSSESQQQPLPVPPQLESLWIEARRAADANLAAERESLNALTVELDARLENMEAALVEAEGALRLAETRFADKAAELERTQSLLEDMQRQRERIESKLANSEATLTQERVSWTTSLREMHEHFARINEAQCSLLTQGIALAERVETSSTLVTKEFAEFRAAESHSRNSSSEKLSTQMATMLEPVSAIPSRLTEVERQIRRQNRHQTSKRQRIVSRGPKY